jgi:pSer/pThr/pTyr-binding forkhead associated (FHA) protein
MTEINALAKITWTDPQTNVTQEYVLAEGATATIGRSASNDIHIPEKHVSRQHAVINYRNGVFMLTDLESANGTFVNDEQLAEPFPLAGGDQIRLYVPLLTFSGVVTEDEQHRAEESGTMITAVVATTGDCRLIITTGPQEGDVIPLRINRVTVGRATTKATWEILLQDPSVSRPHATLEQANGTWLLKDLGSSNGTLVNGELVAEQGCSLNDGDLIAFGSSLVLFRANPTD